MRQQRKQYSIYICGKCLLFNKNRVKKVLPGDIIGLFPISWNNAESINAESLMSQFVKIIRN